MKEKNACCWAKGEGEWSPARQDEARGAEARKERIAEAAEYGALMRPDPALTSPLNLAFWPEYVFLDPLIFFFEGHFGHYIPLYSGIFENIDPL